MKQTKEQAFNRIEGIDYPNPEYLKKMKSKSVDGKDKLLYLTEVKGRIDNKNYESIGESFIKGKKVGYSQAKQEMLKKIESLKMIFCPMCGNRNCKHLCLSREDFNKIIENEIEELNSKLKENERNEK